MPGIDYAAVRRAIPMKRMLQLISYEPTTCHGSQLRGPCPLSRTCSSRSFSVHLDRHLFHCFDCGAGGNQLDLWSALHHLPLYRAAEHLCHQTGIAIPYLNQSGASHNS